jgi:hypothetical protein
MYKTSAPLLKVVGIKVPITNTGDFNPSNTLISCNKCPSVHFAFGTFNNINTFDNHFSDINLLIYLGNWPYPYVVEFSPVITLSCLFCIYYAIAYLSCMYFPFVCIIFSFTFYFFDSANSVTDIRRC